MLGRAVFGVVRRGSAWSGRCRQGADAGQDLGEELVFGWQAQDLRPA
jgi:hypothetical protein